MMHRQLRRISSSACQSCPASAYSATTAFVASPTSLTLPPTSLSSTWTSSSPSSTSSCSTLLSIFTWSMALLLVSSCLGIADAGVLMGHPFSKRSFLDIECKGVYDKSLFARLDRICEDCYNLFREPQLHTLCRKHCFGTEYFTSCIQALLLDDEQDKFQDIADYLGRKK